MKIEAVSVWQLDLPLTKPYRLSGGRLKFERLDSTFVRIETDDGVQGWAEACPWGATYLPAHGKGARAGIAEIAPKLIGLDPRHLNRLSLRGNTSISMFDFRFGRPQLVLINCTRHLG